MNSTIDEASYLQYFDALIAGNRTQCKQILTRLMAAGTDLKDLYINLFQRALYQVGELWENQRVSVAVEHLATAITARLMSELHALTFSGQTRDRSIVIACVADEYHQLGGRMIADFCEMRGWHGHFLGTNTSLPDLLDAIEEHRPSLLGLSLSIYLNLPVLLDAIAAVTERFPALPILVGGQALRWGSLDEVLAYPQVRCVNTLDELELALAAYE